MFVSLIEAMASDSGGVLSVFRLFRIFRIFRLARGLPKVREMIIRIGRTFYKILNLVALMALSVFIFAYASGFRTTKFTQCILLKLAVWEGVASSGGKVIISCGTRGRIRFFGFSGAFLVGGGGVEDDVRGGVRFFFLEEITETCIFQ